MVAFTKYYILLAHEPQDSREVQLTQRAFIARELALGAGAVIRISADTADIVIGHIPTPGRDGIPFSYRDLHCVALELWS
jgi:hypothetical protein